MNSEASALRAHMLVDPEGAPLGLPRSKESLRLQFYIGLALCDALMITIGTLTANLLRNGGPLFGATGLNVVAVLVPIYLAAALNSRAYSIDVLVDLPIGVKRAMLAFAVACGAVLLVAFYLKASSDFSRIMFGVVILLGGGLLAVGRAAMGRLARRLFAGSPLTEVLITDGVKSSRGGDWMIDAGQAGLHPRLDDPLLLDRLGKLLKNADRVVVACPPERREAWAMALKGADVDGEVLLPELDHLGTLGMGDWHGQKTMVVSAGPLTIEERVTKRLLDIAVAGTLMIAVAPLMLLVAIAIKLDSPGPVLFRQARIGRGNRHFAMLKFRSMRTEATDQKGARSADRNDDRVTRIGRLIRATSIDELPQFLNVLIGDMSIVGPRPHAMASTAEDALFWEVDARYWHRHAIKPGMTGLAQIRGFRGATLRRADLINRLQADLEYLSGWTIWRDVSIIMATFRVLVHKNAF